MKVIWLEYKTHEERLKGVGKLNLEKRRLKLP